MQIAVQVQTDSDDVGEVIEEVGPKREPTYGSVEWIQYWSDVEGVLPSPINVSITGAEVYICPELKWYNFDVYPHKIKMTNTGYSVHIGAKWKTQRPYLEGGPLLERHILSQIHFHWGSNMMEGSEHTVDSISYPGEMQVTFFKSEYLTQEEALKHEDGLVMFCYIIKYGVEDDPRLSWLISEFPKIQEAKSNTRVGPYPMSRLIPMFAEDYFLYWGNLKTAKGENHIIRWLVPRVALFASMNQLKAFRKLWDPWDDPNLGNHRPLQAREDRHLFLINPHWNLYNSLLPMGRGKEASISELSPDYKAHHWMLPQINREILALEEAERQMELNRKKPQMEDVEQYQLGQF